MSLSIPTAPIAPAALHELKAWLRIANNEEDALLMGQLRAAMDMARQFTGKQLLFSDIAETVPVVTEWLRLSAAPVIAISAVDAIPLEGSDFELPPEAWQVDIDREARGWVRVTRPANARRLRIRYHAGLAAGWHALPEAVRQGVIRYAAHGYGTRENADSTPPAAVTALWRPWREIAL